MSELAEVTCLMNATVAPDGIRVDGCDYQDIEEHHGCTVIVAKCRRCGRISLSWYQGDGPFG